VLSQAGRIAHDQLLSVSAHYQNVRLDEFVVMPNHVHAIFVIEGRHQYSPPQGTVTRTLTLAPPPIENGHNTLGEVVGGYKSAVSRLIHLAGLREFAWQARFYDHLIRGNNNVDAVRNYIRDNPANWEGDRENQNAR
jgi:REP element-mobilizing transposase RayT